VRKDLSRLNSPQGHGEKALRAEKQFVAVRLTELLSGVG
jgi:hypothetical protein